MDKTKASANRKRGTVPKRVSRLFAVISATSLAGFAIILFDRALHLPNSRHSETDANWNALNKLQITSVLHFNTHHGCARNLDLVLNNLSQSLGHFHYKLDRYDPSHLGYGMTRETAEQLVEKNMYSDQICKGHDLVIVSDTIPHAHGLLLSLIHPDPSKQCGANVVLEITNRFDYSITDPEEVKLYYALFRNLVSLTTDQIRHAQQRVFWVANNNFERSYLEYRLGMDLPFVTVLRPLGYPSPVIKPSDSLTPNSSSIFALYHNHTNVFVLMRKHAIPNLTVFSAEHAHYGGPQTLRNFKAYLEFPYQVSTMKLYENLAAGVVMLIPTPRFLETLWKVPRRARPSSFNSATHYPLWIAPLKQNRDHEILYHMWSLRRLPRRRLFRLQRPLHTARLGFPRWSAFMDYYAPEFAPYIYYFDSWEELLALAALPAAELDSQGVSKGGGAFYEAERGKILEGWRHLFAEMGFLMMIE